LAGSFRECVPGHIVGFVKMLFSLLRKIPTPFAAEMAIQTPFYEF
jgi:hypothetical protein